MSVRGSNPSHCYFLKWGIWLGTNIYSILDRIELNKTVRLFYIDGKEIYTENDKRTGGHVVRYLVDNYELEYQPRTLIVNYTDSEVDDSIIKQIKLLDEQGINANSICLG